MQEKIAAGLFKAKCLQLLDEVRDGHKEFVITKRGEPFARLVPIKKLKQPVMGRMRGTLEIRGDLVAPIEEDWEVDA